MLARRMTRCWVLLAFSPLSDPVLECEPNNRNLSRLLTSTSLAQHLHLALPYFPHSRRQCIKINGIAEMMVPLRRHLTAMSYNPTRPIPWEDELLML